MIADEDLRAAVASGLLSERQALSLTALAEARRGTREAMGPGEEPFELFRGFNEIFIVVGLVILASGWLGLSTLLSLSDDAGFAPLMAVGGGIVWALSEYFVRRRRMVAPAITLSVMFGAAALIAASTFLAGLSEIVTRVISGTDLRVLSPALLIASGLSLIFFVRFRVPFTLAQIALGLFAAIILLLSGVDGTGDLDFRSLFTLGGQGPYAWVTLLFGLAIFALAMRWDMSDPHRVTRRSANGFWLHVVAAPAIVNTVAVTLLADPGAAQLTLLAAFLALIAIVAIVIDRRSFLVAGAGYTVILAGLVGDGTGVAVSVLAIGCTLLLLGAKWEAIRASLLDRLGGVLPRDGLPPAHRQA